jgi:predicted CoA-binding protein
MAIQTTDQVIKDVLTKYKSITVVGLSPQPDRPSYGVTEYMINHGYEIVGVRPGGIKEILRRPVFEDLSEVPGPIEIVNVFRDSKYISQLVDEVLKTDAKVLWLQLGITDPAAEERARRSGLTVISDRCILIEHRRLMR